MTVRTLIEALERIPDKGRTVLISNVLNSPFALVGIKEVEAVNELYPEGAVHIVASK